MKIPLLCSIPLFATLCGQVPAKEPNSLGVCHILNDKVYVASDFGYLLRTSCNLPEGKKPLVEEFGLSLGGGYGPLMHLVDGVIWGEHDFGSIHRMPVDDLKFFDVEVVSGKDEKRWKPLSVEYHKKYPRAPNNLGKIETHQSFGNNVPHSWYLDFVAVLGSKDAANHLMGKPTVYHTYGGESPTPIYVILPTGPTALKTFMLRRDKKIEVWESHGTWRPDLCGWHVKWQRQEKEDFAVPFLEPFYVTTRKKASAAKNEEYYFLTYSGELYVAFPLEGKKPREVKALWQHKQKPITHLIVDRDRDKSYCFGKSKDGKEEFYFELDVMLRAQTVQRSQIQPVKGIDHKRLTAVLEYVQVLPGRKNVEKQP